METLAFEQVTIARVEDGQDGENGANGYTPVKGVDYFDGQDGTDGRSIISTTRYYILSATAPTEPSAEWDMIEPIFNPATDIDKTLYFADYTTFSDGTSAWSEISALSSYEAAKVAYLEAAEAAKTATNYIGSIDVNLVVGDMTGNILGNHVLISPNSVDIRNGDNVLASYGSDTVLYSGGKETFSIKEDTIDYIQEIINSGIYYEHGVTSIKSITVLFEERPELAPIGGAIIYDSTTEITLTSNTPFIFHASIYDRVTDITEDYYMLCYPNKTERLDELSWNLATGSVITLNGMDFPCVFLDSVASRNISFIGSMWIHNNSIANGTTKSTPPFAIGEKIGNHLLIDSMQIMAQSDETTPGPIYINPNGGDVNIGGDIYADKTILAREAIIGDWAAMGGQRISISGKHIRTPDGTGNAYPLIGDNGSNLWIGAFSTSGEPHHEGGTYISAGYNEGKGNPTIYVSVPKAGNTGANNYAVIHAGLIQRTAVTISGLPSGSSYSCYYYPFLGICFLRLYLTGKAIAAKTTTTIGTVESGYRANARHALALMPSQNPISDTWAWTTSDGTISFYSQVAKVSTDDIYITGFWLSLIHI